MLVIHAIWRMLIQIFAKLLNIIKVILEYYVESGHFIKDLLLEPLGIKISWSWNNKYSYLDWRKEVQEKEFLAFFCFLEEVKHSKLFFYLSIGSVNKLPRKSSFFEKQNYCWNTFTILVVNPLLKCLYHLNGFIHHQMHNIVKF